MTERERGEKERTNIVSTGKGDVKTSAALV